MIGLLFWKTCSSTQSPPIKSLVKLVLKQKNTNQTYPDLFFGGERSVSCTFAHHSSCSARPSKAQSPLSPDRLGCLPCAKSFGPKRKGFFATTHPIHRKMLTEKTICVPGIVLWIKCLGHTPPFYSGNSKGDCQGLYRLLRFGDGHPTLRDRYNVYNKAVLLNWWPFPITGKQREEFGP